MNKDTLNKVIKFRNDRGWEKDHTPKNLAISISLEANELLENFQWDDSKFVVNNNRENIKEEIADVLIYCISLLDKLDMDFDNVILEKLDKNKIKYPINSK